LRSVEDPALAWRTCARLGSGHLHSLLGRNNPVDFGLKETLNADNWKALRRVGAETNARSLSALGEGQAGLPDPATLEPVVLPSTHDGQRAPGLRFGDPGPWPRSPRWRLSPMSWAA
jgi:hypothetical protein